MRPWNNVIFAPVSPSTVPPSPSGVFYYLLPLLLCLGKYGIIESRKTYELPPVCRHMSGNKYRICMKLNKLKPMQRLVFIIGIVLFAAGIACQSSAMVVTLSTENLTKTSDVIITGAVLNTKSFWSADKHFIYTMATVAILEVIKGRPLQKSLTVVHEGGEVDGIGLKVSDVAPLTTGETVLLFLSPEKTTTADVRYRIVGRAQGKYSIDKNGMARKGGYTGEDGKPVTDLSVPLHSLLGEIYKYDSGQR